MLAKHTKLQPNLKMPSSASSFLLAINVHIYKHGMLFQFLAIFGRQEHKYTTSSIEALHASGKLSLK